MLINRAAGWVVITPPKTGSISLNRLLVRPAFGAGLTQDGWHHGTVLPPGCEGFRVYLSTRDPFARAASLWRHQFRDDYLDRPVKDFAEFAATVLAGQPWSDFYSPRLVDWAKGLELTGTIPLERIGEALTQLGPTAGYTVPHENPDPQLLPWRTHYERCPAAWGLVRAWGEADRARFGYSDVRSP